MAKQALRYQAPRSLYIDVDGTLIRHGVLNQSLVGYIMAHKRDGYYIVLWSMRGREYAEATALSTGTTHLFDAIIPKPGIVADDKGWAWARDCKMVRLDLLDAGEGQV